MTKKFSEFDPLGAGADDAQVVGVDALGRNIRMTLAVLKTWIQSWLTKAMVGLGNVDNTSDVNKPVSTAQQTAIDAKVADSITDGVTTIAPSQNAVFDGLALKFDKAGGSIGGSTTITSGDLSVSSGKVILPAGTDTAPALTLGTLGFSYNATTFAGLHINASAGSAVSITAIGDGNSGGVNATRHQDSSSGPAMALRKTRGSYATQTAVQLNDNLGTIAFSGHDGTAVRNAATIVSSVTETGTISTSALGSRLYFQTCAIGSGSLSETLGVQAGAGVTWGGASNVVIDSNRNVRARVYTVATLPSASAAAGQRAQVSDASSPVFGSAVTGGGSQHCPVYSNGTSWLAG